MTRKQFECFLSIATICFKCCLKNFIQPAAVDLFISAKIISARAFARLFAISATKFRRHEEIVNILEIFRGLDLRAGVYPESEAHRDKKSIYPFIIFLPEW